MTILMLNVAVLMIADGGGRNAINGMIETIKNDPQKFAEFIERKLIPGIRLRLQ